MLKYENWVYCPLDNQYAPKKLKHDCVWLSHLKGFAYICNSLCKYLAALQHFNLGVWGAELEEDEAEEGLALCTYILISNLHDSIALS